MKSNNTIRAVMEGAPSVGFVKAGWPKDAKKALTP